MLRRKLYFHRPRIERRCHGSPDLEIHLGGKSEVLKLSTGKLARFADGSTVAKLGGTSVITTVVSKKAVSSSFLPLQVDYRQKASAAGRIPTNFLRREFGPSDREILVSRFIDRALRPLFPKGYNNETQIVANLLAADGVTSPDVLSLNGASAALSVSNIPWNGPIGAANVGCIDNNLTLNPTRKEKQNSRLNLVVAGTKNNLMVMAEAQADILDKSLFLEAMEFGIESCSKIASQIEIWSRSVGRPKREFSVPHLTETMENGEIYKSVKLLTENKLRNIYQSNIKDKTTRDTAMFGVFESAMSSLKESFPHVSTDTFNSVLKDVNREVIEILIFDDHHRLDGRKFEEIRDISCETGMYSPLHGSSLFQRGQTQVLCTVALDSIESSLKTDPMSVLTGDLKEKNFFLHYEFPSYATNEIGRTFSAGRRELGHGALAEKALIPVIPKDNPFAIRLTSEVLESNGSSSMASVCGGSLALMDAGICIKAPVAGIAVGLLSRSSDQCKDYQLLLDILGQEDHCGDMDFKIAGTAEGITAFHVDVKIPGLSLKVVKESIALGHKGILRVLEIMNSCLSSPRTDKTNLPEVKTISIPMNKRSKFIGPSGYNIRRITSQTGVRISPADADGTWTVFAHNSEAMAEAEELIEESLKDEREIEFTFGALYKVTVLELESRGIHVQIHSAVPPVFIPNSQLSATKISHPSAADIKEGQELQVKCYGRDPVTGSLRLSRKVLTVAKSAAVNSMPPISKRSELVNLTLLPQEKTRCLLSHAKDNDNSCQIKDQSDSSNLTLDECLSRYVSSKSTLERANKNISDLKDDIKDLKKRIQNIMSATSKSLLAECYLPSLYKRYKDYTSRISIENESLKSLISEYEDAQMRLKSVQGNYSFRPNILDEIKSPNILKENESYNAKIKETLNSGYVVTITDSYDEHILDNVFVSSTWLRKSCQKTVGVGERLKLIYQGPDTLTNTLRFTEENLAICESGKIQDIRHPFKTFNPQQLSKFDEWSSSPTYENENFGEDDHIFFNCMQFNYLYNKDKLHALFLKRIEYLKTLNHLVSGSYSRKLFKEVLQERKDIVSDCYFIYELISSLNATLKIVSKAIKTISNLSENSKGNYSDTLIPVKNEIRSIEKYFTDLFVSRLKIPGEVLAEYEKSEILDHYKRDKQSTVNMLVRLIDGYSDFIRTVDLTTLNDWVDYETLPTFALNDSIIYDLIKHREDDKLMPEEVDVRVFKAVLENVKRKEYPLIMKVWLKPEFKKTFINLCDQYLNEHENLVARRKMWWNVRYSDSEKENESRMLYDRILKLKNILKITACETKLLSRLIKLLPGDETTEKLQSDMGSIYKYIKILSLGDESLAEVIFQQLESNRIAVKKFFKKWYSSV